MLAGRWEGASRRGCCARLLLSRCLLHCLLPCFLYLRFPAMGFSGVRRRGLSISEGAFFDFRRRLLAPFFIYRRRVMPEAKCVGRGLEAAPLAAVPPAADQALLLQPLQRRHRRARREA